MERKKHTATLRAVRFTAGDMAHPVACTLVLRREHAERLRRDLERLLRETPGPVELVAKWVGTLCEERQR